VARLGIARTFQNIRLLGHLSVLDNVKIAFHHHIKYHIFSAALRLPGYFRDERQITEKSRQFLHLLNLDNERFNLAEALPYGSRRKLEIARALATEGKLLLLDEPAAGMNPQETSELMAIIRRINQEFRLTILLIEHDMRLMMSLSHRLIVMDHGKVIASGSPNEVKNNPDVIAAYLGVRRE
jgi:branched-chain amino acid transport system ATP-binding protein